MGLFTSIYEKLDSNEQLMVSRLLDDLYLEKRKKTEKPKFGVHLKRYLELFELDYNKLAEKMASDYDSKEDIARKLRQVMKRETGNYSDSARVAEILGVPEDVLNYGTVCASVGYMYDRLDKNAQITVFQTAYALYARKHKPENFEGCHNKTGGGYDIMEMEESWLDEKYRALKKNKK